MLDRILDLLSGSGSAGMPVPGRPDSLQVAVAALLVEAARMDERFDPAERTTIRRLLARRFALDEAETGRLLEAAESEADDSVHLYRFVRAVTEGWSHDQRVGLIEMLWETAYADGSLDPHEDQLLRQVAGLVHVSDRERGEARLRVLARLGAADA